MGPKETKDDVNPVMVVRHWALLEIIAIWYAYDDKQF